MSGIKIKIRLDALVRERFALSWGKSRQWIETGKIWCGVQVLKDPGMLMDPLAPLELKMTAPAKKRVNHTPPDSAVFSPSHLIYADTQIVVVNKPPGVNTVQFQDGNSKRRETPSEPSLDEWVARALKQPKVHVVHRLDRETSGLLVFARTLPAAKLLANQFRFRKIHRKYLALAHGRVESQTFRSILLEDRGDGLRGSVRNREDEKFMKNANSAKQAITHVRRISFQEGVSLVECRLETGRTHQIRIHLSEAGHPLLGEKLYIREFPQDLLAAAPPAARVMLHAAELGFQHPSQNQEMRWELSPPEDFTLK